MTLFDALFAVLALAVAASAVGVVVSHNIVRAAVWLLFTLVGVSLLYFLLGAEFLGAAQLIVYVGGTMVLVVFGVMLTSAAPGEQYRPSGFEWIAGSILAVALFATIASASLKQATPPPRGDMPAVEPLGQSFLGIGEPYATTYLLPFEIVSVHLLVVLIAAAYLARAKRKVEAK